MSSRSIAALALVSLICLGSGVIEVRAEDSVKGPSDGASPSRLKKGAKVGKKGNKVREKDAEGTQAADRFEAHTVIKSRYTLDGETLEVDPD